MYVHKAHQRLASTLYRCVLACGSLCACRAPCETATEQFEASFDSQKVPKASLQFYYTGDVPGDDPNEEALVA